VTLDELTTGAFLAISVEGLVVHVWGLLHLAPAAGRSSVRRALVRTLACRVACAVLYVYVGLNAVVLHRAVIVTTFLVYFVTQVIWQVNTAADVHLRRSLTDTGTDTDRTHTTTTSHTSTSGTSDTWTN
jgi:hypothetical protein